MRQSFSLGRVFGIEVRVHATWLLAFAFVTWGLANGYFRFIAPRQGLGLPLLLGALSALLLFGSVLVHEFSHSLVAQALGMRVRDITLFIFGGVSNIGGEATSARNEFLIAVVGPLTSLALAAIFWMSAQALGGTTVLDLLLGSGRGLRTMTPPAAILNYLASINLLLGLFNLVPAFPLDGGRVFRSVIWGATHRFDRATTIAATVGQGFGYVMIGLGIVRLVFGDIAGGVWTMFIGWFLAQAASATRRDRHLRETLRGVQVRQLMDPSVPVVDAGTSLQQLVFEHLLRSDRGRFIAVRDGQPVGVVDAGAVKGVPRDAWRATSVERIMGQIAFSVAPETDAADLLDRLGERTSLVAVVDNGQLVGGVDVARVVQFAQFHMDLQRAAGRSGTNAATAV
ncbi:MAG: site-2 protease family protein [Chloroflexi bacterium]|nr:site-2 protease family protein [Chloroflexota bacterium]